MTKIFLIRHAEAEGNIYRRAHGQFDGQIAGRGFRQIEQLKKRFTDEKIDAVYSSDLSRTRTTAAAINVPRGLPLREERDLREVNVGAWEDVAWGDIKAGYPQMHGLFSSDPGKWRVDGSEAFERVQSRMTGCIRKLAGRHDGGAIAVFSHGFAIRSFLCGVMGVPSRGINAVQYCDNTAVTLLTYDDGELGIEYQGDNSHLDGGLSTFSRQTWWRDEEERRSEDMRFLAGTPTQTSAGGASNALEYTAYLDNGQAGLLTLLFEGDGTGSAAWIRNIYIKPELRRKGFGIQLIGQAVADSRKRKRENLCIEIPGGGPAIDYFRNHGFVVENETDLKYTMIKNVRNW